MAVTRYLLPNDCLGLFQNVSEALLAGLALLGHLRNAFTWLLGALALLHDFDYLLD